MCSAKIRKMLVVTSPRLWRSLAAPDYEGSNHGTHTPHTPP